MAMGCGRARGVGVAEVLSCKGQTQKQRVTPSVNSGPGHCYFAV